MSMDHLIYELGDCGLFQILMIAVIHSASVPSEWAVTFMAFGNYNPGWTCADHQGSRTNAPFDFSGGPDVSTNDHVNVTFKSLAANSSVFSCQDYRKCKNVTFSTDSSTVVTEWHLACDERWITSLMLSIQRVGYVIGALGCGILSDRFGRKPIHILGLFLQLALNLAAVLSPSWPIFTVIRFFLGITAGSLNISSFVYPMEFVTDKWRAIVSALPFTNFGNFLFALFAWWLKDWRNLHLATAAMTILCFIPSFWLPESARWLAIKGKTEKATKIVEQISKINRKKPTNINAISIIAEEEKSSMRSRENYSVRDLYRHGLGVRTSIMSLAWVYAFACHTMIMYGIQSLFGDFYINFIMFNIFPSITLSFTSILTTTIGRKKAGLTLLSIACISCLILIVLHFSTGNFNKGLGNLVVTLVFLLIVDAFWSIVMLLGIELYPTGLRSTSYSFGCCIGSLGGVVAPFLIPHDQASLFISHMVMAGLTFTVFLSFFFLPETKGKPLDECLPLRNDFDKK